MANVVGERFQITIDKAIRAELRVRPGDLAVERVEDGRLVIEFVPAQHHDSLRGILACPGAAPIGDWQATRDRAWDMRAAEILDVLKRDSDRHARD